MYNLGDRKGFTLIELLVVITIIAILSAVGVTVYSGVRKSSQTAKRLADMKAIQMALEVYHSDPVNNSQYPSLPSPGGWRSECVGWGGYTADDVIPGLVPKYLAAMPADPDMNKDENRSCYMYVSDGKDYALLDHVIAGYSVADYQKHTSFRDPTRDGGTDGCAFDGTTMWAWKVSSPGGRCW